MGTAAATVVWGLAATVQAGDPPPPPQSGQPAADAPKKPDAQERMICREDTDLGSRVSRHRVCHTKREWDQIDRDAQDILDNSPNRSGTTTPR
jgi:hypothetical protein